MRRTVTPVSFSRSAMTGPSVWPSYGLPCIALACSTNGPPLGMANPHREIEQRAKALFERCVALDLAANVTDDAAKPRAQKLQFPPGAAELVGMRVAPHHDGGTLG